MTKLSEHFDDSEFRCKCCKKLPTAGMDKDLINLLEDIRTKLNKPVTITSGYRCEKHNEACGGAPKSQHLLGQAADIQVSGMSAAEVHLFIEHHFYKRAKGLGKYPRFTHVDVRDGAITRWNGNG
jgi:uncharacterized protein YcbK (DUF882 family)